MKLNGVITSKNAAYVYRVSPDILVRGGIYGNGTSVGIWRFDPATKQVLGHRGYQGSFSLRRIKNLIRLWEEMEPVSNQNSNCAVCGNDCQISWHKGNKN